MTPGHSVSLSSSPKSNGADAGGSATGGAEGPSSTSSASAGAPCSGRTVTKMARHAGQRTRALGASNVALRSFSHVGHWISITPFLGHEKESDSCHQCSGISNALQTVRYAHQAHERYSQ